MGLDGLFVSQRTGGHSAGIHVPFTNCFVCRWFCVVHDPKPPLHSHNWLSFGKFQDTERFLIHCERHFSSRLPPSGGTWKYAKAPSTKKLGEILLICSFLPCLSWLLRSRVRKSRRDLRITLYNTKIVVAVCDWKRSMFCLSYLSRIAQCEHQDAVSESSHCRVVPRVSAFILSWRQRIFVWEKNL